MKSRKPLNRFWNRSKIFYKIRFKLLMRDVELSKISQLNYNKYNSKKSIPKVFYKYNEKIFADRTEQLSDFDKVKTITIWLRTHVKGGSGLGVHSEESLKLMLNGNYGVCSDFTQVFNNFCVINNILVREWGVNNETLTDNGHAFNEVYIKELKKWILFDVSRALFFSSAETGEPLSVYEVFDFSKKHKDKNYHCLIEQHEPPQNWIQEFYYSDDQRPYLVDKYNNTVYDFFLKNFKRLPIPIVHGLIFLLGKSYRFKRILLSS